jgi:hypothetical protein
MRFLRVIDQSEYQGKKHKTNKQTNKHKSKTKQMNKKN